MDATFKKLSYIIICNAFHGNPYAAFLPDFQFSQQPIMLVYYWHNCFGCLLQNQQSNQVNQPTAIESFIFCFYFFSGKPQMNSVYFQILRRWNMICTYKRNLITMTNIEMNGTRPKRQSRKRNLRIKAKLQD